MIKVIVCLCIGFAVFFISGLNTSALSSSKISQSLNQKFADGAKSLPILVRLKAKADLSFADTLVDKVSKGQYVYDALRKVALDTQADLIEFLHSKRINHRRFYISNMIVIDKADEGLVRQLALRDDVEAILGNPEIKLKLPPRTIKLSEARTTVETSVISTGAARVWEEFKVKGAGILVAGQDSGVQWDHPALINQYVGYSNGKVDHNYNWHDAIHPSASNNKCGYDTQAPCDDGSHGTHTMGTILGLGEKNQIGMAPDAKWMACRNMDNGDGTPATYLECFEFFLAPYVHGANPMTEGDPSRAPHVINNSWGCPPSEGCQGDEILPALEAMAKAGIMVVASAGNEGPACSTIQDPPAYHTGSTLSVGAFNHRTGKIANFSSRGPSTFDNQVGPDLVAPGVSIRSSVPGNKYGSGWNGTSMASPHVAGAVALLWSAEPSLIGKISETIEILRETSDRKKSTQTCGNVSGSDVPNNVFGYGSLNIYNAVKSVTF